MKNQYLSLRTLVMLVWALFVLTLTTQTDRVPVVHLMIALIGRTELGATIGHAALFGLLTAIAYAALRLPRRNALLLAMGLALALGTATEFYQQVVAGRTASLADLLANWLGVFVVAFGVVYWQGLFCRKLCSRSRL
ncbi:MAG: VanZ family protein [Chloroflexi bacterium]|nr:VanZ family protein [Chloroflexota bacterium]